MKTNERTSRENDLHNADLYLVNGIVCDFCDLEGKYPTVDDIRQNWQLSRYGTGQRVTDDEIERIIRLVERQDMGLWN